ncbi:saccharopine dehydrogenase [Gordonia malaquae]|uniref:saccharopine dehydrogenase n=1 Tax=Gordonia malaquae TaxID=410332 RepID=UPI0030C78640
MKALLLGGRGAVGTVVRRELERSGHSVTVASRSSDTPIDLHGDLDTLSESAIDHDVVINTSGVERADLATAVGDTPLVDISATGSYLADLRRSAVGLVVLGAGLAPGLSTLLVSDVVDAPGDAVDVFVMLGAGEKHGAAAVEWTEGLIGSDVFAPPESGRVINLRESVRATGPDGVMRRYLRADFPDHVLLSGDGGPTVRTYFTLTSAPMTSSLALVARMPVLRPTLRWAPPIGSDRWHVAARNRRTGTERSTSGAGQSEATGVLTALAAERAAVGSGHGAVTMADVMTLSEATAALNA